MLILLALPVGAAVVLMHRYLQLYAPSNLIVRRVWTAPPRWRTVAVLGALATTLLLAMHALTLAIEGGAPGWLHLVVLVLAWDAIKVAWAAIGLALRGLAMAGRQMSHRNV